MRLLVLLASALALAEGPAGAEPVTLRFASLAPEGTSWARALQAASREVERQTHGQLKLKWYLGGIAGGEDVVPDRIRRGQLDGEAAGISCANLAPSLRVLRIVGLFRRRQEAHAVINKLRPQVEAEFQKAGYVLLAVQWLGSDILLTRTPVQSLADLRRLRLYVWNLDSVFKAEMPLLHWRAVPMSPEQAARAYDEGRIDGFFAMPAAALAFQWSARARYYGDLTIALMPACTFMTRQAFDALPLESQRALRAAATQASLSFEDIDAAQEDALLGGLFDRQGMKRVPASVSFREELLIQARAVRDALPESVVPRALVIKVLGWLSDFRGEGL